MSTPTISIPRSQKRWPISTIFTHEKMHTIFVSSSIQFTIHLWKFVEDYHTTFVLGIILHSLPLLYHLRHPFHTTFVLLKFSNHLSTNQFPNFPVFPAFPSFPPFPAFPAFPVFPPFPAIPKVPPIPAIPQKSSVLLFFCLFSPFVLLSKKEPRTARLSVPAPLWDKNQSALCERTIGTKQKNYV